MTSPTPQPTQAGAPSGAPQPQQQQANPLQETLGKLAMLVRQLGTQNTIIQPEMQQASAIFVQALQKASQAQAGPAQPMQAPPQQ
jgi:hypothetical protein